MTTIVASPSRPLAIPLHIREAKGIALEVEADVIDYPVCVLAPHYNRPAD
jgi:hypothetical protein